MKASAGFAASTALRKFARSSLSGPASLSEISPMQRGRRYFAVAPLAASFAMKRGNSTRSWPGSRGVSPPKPAKRSAM